MEDEHAAEALARLVEHGQRVVPVFVVSLDEEEIVLETAAIGVVELAKRTAGLAVVAVVTGPMTFALTDRWGRPWSCFHRAVRAYFPGLDPYAQSLHEHPLFLPRRIESWRSEHGLDLVEHLRSLAANESLRRTIDDRDIPSFVRVKQVALQNKREQARSAGRSDADQLALAQAELEQLQEERARLEADVVESLNLAQAADDDRRKAEREMHALRSRIQGFEDKLKVAGRDVKSDILVPETLENLREWAEDNLVGKLVLVPRALRAAKTSEFENIEVIYRALMLSAAEYRDMRIEGGDDAANRFELSEEHEDG